MSEIKNFDMSLKKAFQEIAFTIIKSASKERALVSPVSAIEKMKNLQSKLQSFIIETDLVNDTINSIAKADLLIEELTSVLKPKSQTAILLTNEEIVLITEATSRAKRIVENLTVHLTTETSQTEDAKLRETIDQLDAIQEARTQIENRKSKEAALVKKINELSDIVSNLEEKAKSKMEIIDEFYSKTKADLDTKLIGINEQLGTLTAATMAKDYAEFADIEKAIADEYRKYSLWAMFGVAAVVAFTIWQSAKGEFTITESLIRLSFILIISAPAIYLSRESAKHRNQENQHRQTNLDLRAITPYIASLSKTEQSQLKTQIALRLFGARNNSTSHKEEIPINVNDLLLKLLDKVDLSGKPEKETKTE